MLSVLLESPQLVGLHNVSACNGEVIEYLINFSLKFHLNLN
jgi:hypothetical protein